MSKVVMIQPIAFLPRQSWMHRMVKSDVFVLLDSVRLGRNHENRTPIKLQDERHWLVVPLAQRRGVITRVRIDWEEKWEERMVEKVIEAYSESPFFDELFPSFVDRLRVARSEWLLDYDMALLGWLIGILGIRTSLVMQSELGEFRMKRTDLVLEIMKHVQGEVYHCGDAFGAIPDAQRFRDEGMELKVYAGKEAGYPQAGTGFIGDLSVLDALFNVGIRGTKEILEIR